jgi:hypothetical protein
MKDENMINRGVRRPGASRTTDDDNMTPEQLRQALQSMALLQQQQIGVSAAEQIAHSTQVATAEHLANALTVACSTGDTPMQPRPLSLKDTGHESTCNSMTPQHIDQKVAALIGGEPTTEPGAVSRPALYNPLAHTPFNPSATLAGAVMQLTVEQRGIYNRAAKAMLAFARWLAEGCSGDPPAPLLLFIHGGPGVGKSFLFAAIRLHAFEMGLRDIAVAPFASAANIIKGRTYHGAVGHTGKGRLDAEPSRTSMAALAKMHGINTCWGVIGDETSAVLPDLFESAGSRISIMAKREHLRWAGLSVLLFGDLFQLKPVPPLSLYDVVIKHFVFKDAALPPAHRKAAEFFVTLEKAEFIQNMRARNDPMWAAVLRRIRDATPGHRPLADALLPLLEQMILTQGDVMDDPAFQNAVVLLSGNYERAHIIKERVQALARSLGVPVVRWRLALSGSVANLLTHASTDRSPLPGKPSPLGILCEVRDRIHCEKCTS